MTKFEKSYIGKGKKVQGMNIVKVTVPLEKLQEIAYEYDGVAYVTFEIAEMKETDQFGRTHACYHSKMLQEALAPAKKAKKLKSIGKKASPVEPLPF
ncbi:MAG: hypothetical protein WCW62_16525 [Bacteroidales bacterium]